MSHAELFPTRSRRRRWPNFRNFISKSSFVIVLSVITLIGANRPLLAAGRPVTVVELFTSQGCSAGSAPPRPADVWIVRYDPRVVDVPVQRGESAGRTLPHGNVVHDLVHLGSWNGGAATYRLTPAPDGQNTAILVQFSQGGLILAAATN